MEELREVECCIFIGPHTDLWQKVEEGSDTCITLCQDDGPTYIVPLTAEQEGRLSQYTASGLRLTLPLTGEQAYQIRRKGEGLRPPKTAILTHITAELLSRASTDELKALKNILMTILIQRKDY